jgi:hypothetical protein
MRKQMLMAALIVPSLALAQATKMSSETKVESTTTTPSTKSEVTSDKTVKQKTDGTSSTVVEQTATQKSSAKPTHKTYSKTTVEKNAAGSVTKSETEQEKK